MKKRTLQLMLSLLILSTPALSHAYGATYYYGIFQTPNAPFVNAHTIVDGVYERQDFDYVSGLTRVVFATNYGYPPVENEEWRYEVKKVSTGEVLSYISFIWKQEQDYGCILAEVDGSGYFYIGCSYEIWQVYLVGSFKMLCFDAEEYEMATSHSEFLFDPIPFKPTPFEPKPAIIDGGSVLTSIAPTLPGNSPQITTLSVTVKDDQGCEKPMEDIPVTVKNTIVPGSASHKHFTSEDEIGTGKYVDSLPAWSSIGASNTTISATTDVEGAFLAKYEAGEYGVQEHVEIAITNPETGDTLYTDASLDIKIPGLSQLSGSDELYRVLGGYTDNCGDRQHNDGPLNRRSNYLYETVLLSVENVANEYLIHTNGRVSFNDASLEYGGFFDNGVSTSREAWCHRSHRQGIDIDVNHIDKDGRNVFTFDSIGVNGGKQKLLAILTALVELEDGWKVEEDGTPIHYRFNR